jgi:hypothetical protein
MNQKTNDIITEEEKSKLRQNAIVKEFYRLSKSLRRKKQVIAFYRVVTVAIFASFCSFIYFNKPDKSTKQVEEVKHVISVKQQLKTDSSKLVRKTKSNVISYYTVYFENESAHPLAQFSSKKMAEEFCKTINEMELPITRIENDTIFRNRKNLPKDNYPYRYAVQLGAYHSDVLKKYRENLIWIIDQQDDNYYKYRIAPFYGYSKSTAFTSKIEMKETYILPF